MAAKVTSLTESAILSAITVILALVAMYVPFLGMVALLIWPLPMIVLFVRHGLKWTLMAVFVSLLLSAVLIEPMAAVRLAVSFAPTGLALGYGYHAGLSGVKTFLAGMTASAAAKLGGLYLVFLLTGIDPFSGQLEMMPQQFEQAVVAYEQMGMTAEQIATAREQFMANLKILSLAFPLIVVLMALLDTGLNFWLGGKLLRRFGEPVPVFPAFLDWHLPLGFAYAYAFSLIGMYWGKAHDIPVLFQVSLNFSLAGIAAGLIQGVVIYRAAAIHYQWPKIAANIGLFLIVCTGFLTQLLVFTGLCDMVFDYRRRFGWRK